MIGGTALLLPIIVNNAMHAYDTTNTEHKNSSSNDYTDDEIIYMRERMTKPWDGTCHVYPRETYICHVDPFIGENKYALKEEGK